MRYHAVSTVLAVLCLSSICYSELTVEELLAKYDQAQKRIQTKYIRSETVREDRDSWAQKSEWFLEISEFYTDGNRMDLKYRNWISIRDRDDRELPDFGYKQTIWDGERWYEYWEAEKVEASRVFISSREERKDRSMAVAYPGAPLGGYFPGDLKAVSSIFNEADDVRLYDEKENINGISCYVLEAITAYGKHRIWLDPEHGYHICQAEVVKGKDDIFGGKPVSTPYPDWAKLGIKQPVGEPPLPTSPRVEIAFAMRNVKFQEDGGICVPVSADWEIKTTHENGRVIAQRFNHKCTEIDLSPDFEAAQAFVPKIRNGTNVFIEGENPIVPQHWVDGRVEYNIDKDVLESADAMIKELMEQPISENVVPAPQAQQKEAAAKVETSMPDSKPIASQANEGIGTGPGSVALLILGCGIALGLIGLVALRIRRARHDA